jgi:putative membrane protein
MWLDAILAYLHFAAILAVVWFLAKAWALLRAGADAIDAPRLFHADIGYLILLGVVLLTGAARAVFGIKGWAFYADNPAFHIKVTLFLLLALGSITPLRIFHGWHKARLHAAAYQVPLEEWRAARSWLMIQMHLIALMPLAAVVLARGLL